MIWKRSCVKGMQGITFKIRTKKAPVLNEETKRGRRVVMPQANQNDKI